jgi:hypothetical protein
MSIDIATLEKATLAIFQHLKESGVHSIEFEHDFYWDIDKQQRYNPYQQPTQMSLGQLIDDWNEIEKIALGDKEAIGFAFVWMASLYRYVGEIEPG